MGGSDQVVSVLAFYSNDPSSNLSEVNYFSVNLHLKRMKINKKKLGLSFEKNENKQKEAGFVPFF